MSPNSLSEPSLIVGFSDEETDRIIRSLKKLLIYLQSNNFILVGGLAIRHHCLFHQIPYPHRPLNDIDISVKSVDAISSSVTNDFLVYHYHPQKFFLALVDPITKIKVDIFDYESTPQETINVYIGGAEVQMVSIEEQLIKTIVDLQRISSEENVDPKQFADARLLLQIADPNKLDWLWRLRCGDLRLKEFTLAITRAETIAKKYPEWVQKNPFRKPTPYFCAFCKSDSRFQVVPMKKIYNLLGYTE